MDTFFTFSLGSSLSSSRFVCNWATVDELETSGYFLPVVIPVLSSNKKYNA